MGVSIDTRWSLNGLKAVILENEFLNIVILPEAGGKIYSIRDNKHQVELLWQNPRVNPTRPDSSASFDDNWAGGWDDILPNDQAVVFKGEPLPDHGELWNVVWDYSVIQRFRGEVRVRLETKTRIYPLHIVKELSLKEGARGFKVSYSITNIGYEAVEYFLRLHPAFRVEEGSILEIPGGIVYPDKTFNNPACNRDSYEWPFMPIADRGDIETRDMSVIPAASVRETVFQYIHLKEGWFSIYHPKRETGLKMDFDKKLFPYITYFASFGGWRGHYTAVVEPSTGYPSDLGQASREGRTSIIEPNGTLCFGVGVSLMGNQNINIK